MRAYAQLLVKTCHRRGAHAMGGMAALHPQPARPGAERAAPGEGARGQGARGGRRLRRNLGRAPRPRPGRPRRVRRVLGTPNQLDRQREDVSRRRRGAARRVVHARRRDRGRAAQRTSASASATSSAWLGGTGACRDLQPDGGRGDGRDRPLADLAVGAPRPVLRGDDRSCASIARSDERRPERGLPAAPRRELFEQVALARRASSNS